MDRWQEATELLLSVSPARWCQVCFTLATCAVLAVAIAPSAERKLLVNYGARGHDSTATAAAHEPARGEDDVFFAYDAPFKASPFGTFVRIYTNFCTSFG